MQATDSLPTDALVLLHSTIARIEGVYAPATIRAYFADFAAFINFCDLNNQSTLPANAGITADLFVISAPLADHRPVFGGRWWRSPPSIF